VWVAPRSCQLTMTCDVGPAEGVSADAGPLAAWFM
jgi:hypothetical protein